jgi:hypothetical protein
MDAGYGRTHWNKRLYEGFELGNPSTDEGKKLPWPKSALAL